jgi:hypothetical protein
MAYRVFDFIPQSGTKNFATKEHTKDIRFGKILIIKNADNSGCCCCLEFILPSKPAEGGEEYIFYSAASGHLSSLEQVYF